MNALKIKVEIPQKKAEKWRYRVARYGGEGRMSQAANATSMYRRLENRVDKFFLDRESKHKTCVWVTDGIYHNDGEWEDKDMALYGLTCFLEDHLSKDFVKSRLTKYFHGV
jgi:hypothetical protein